MGGDIRFRAYEPRLEVRDLLRDKMIREALARADFPEAGLKEPFPSDFLLELTT